MVKKEKTPLRLHAKHDPIPSPEEVRHQLKRILENPEFQATGRQREFLQFVVTETIAGRVEEIKGYTVATQVFGRKEDFDQSIDPVVSIQANKLRRALERYYLVAGKNDPVRIDIPKGTYVPTFQMQPPEEPGAVSGMAEREVQAGMGGWPSVLVRPFKNLTGDVEQDFLVEGLSTELAIEMTRYQDIMVLMNRTPGAGKFDPEPVAQFLVEGSVRMDQEIIKVAVYLIEMKTGRQIWGDMYHCDLDAAQLIAFQEEVAQVVAANISGEHGMISKTLSIESKNKAPSDLSTYEAILAYHQYDMAVTADTFFRAMEALKGAADIEPECGQVWSMLGRLYADNYSLEYFDIKTPIDKAVAFAEKGISLNPANQRARAVLAYVRLLSDEIPAARVEAERALALNPNSLLFMDNIGYLLALSGEWEHGPALMEKAIKLNPYHRNYVHYGLWLNWFRQKEYERSYQETLNFRMTGDFWDPLAQAATFGQLGRYEEGKQAVENLLKLKPDFPSCGRMLIGHYIKFEEIRERFMDGLYKAELVCK